MYGDKITDIKFHSVHGSTGSTGKPMMPTDCVFLTVCLTQINKDIVVKKKHE